MAELNAVFIPGVWVSTRNWYVLAVVKFEFLRCYAVVFASFFAG